MARRDRKKSRKSRSRAPRGGPDDGARRAPAGRGAAEPAPEVGDEAGTRKRAGQIASEAARFDLGPHGRVIGDALGSPPPGYGTTVVSLFVRDPGHVVAVWDVNDDASLDRAAERGWEALELRIAGPDGVPLTRVPVGERSGVYHVALERGGVTATAEIGFVLRDGTFQHVARSVPVRVPAAPSSPGAAPVRVTVPPEIDRRGLLRAEGPVRVGHRPLAPEVAPAARLVERLRLARRILTVPPAAMPEFAAGSHAGGESPAGHRPPAPSRGAPPKAPHASPRSRAGRPAAPSTPTPDRNVPPRSAGEPPRSLRPGATGDRPVGPRRRGRPGGQTASAPRDDDPGSAPRGGDRVSPSARPSGGGPRDGRGPSGEGRDA